MQQSLERTAGQIRWVVTGALERDRGREKDAVVLQEQANPLVVRRRRVSRVRYVDELARAPMSESGEHWHMASTRVRLDDEEPTAI